MASAPNELPVPSSVITPDEALQLVLEHVRCLPSRRLPVTDACGLQLAEPIRADRDYPPFVRATMDGYAVRADDAGRNVSVVGEIPAGRFVGAVCSSGQCFEIMTGAPCPRGTDAVVPKEYIRRDGDRVLLPRDVVSGQYVAPRGSECRRGELVLNPGVTITPLAVAVMASFGKSSVQATPKPSVGIITTGTELVPIGEQPKAAEIRDSNGPMLLALARERGIEQLQQRHTSDHLDAILAALTDLAGCDILLLTGGVSVGSYDLVPQALLAFGVDVIFHRVRQKPGKPLLFATKGPQLFFGLPGNPLASHFCFHRYVTPAIRQTSGKSPSGEVLHGELTEPVPPKPVRTCFVAARAERDERARTWKIRAMPGVTSADIFGACQANCYARIPPGHEEIPAGETVEFSWVSGPPLIP
jgi:molybdopterin molybdotransferase